MTAGDYLRDFVLRVVRGDDIDDDDAARALAAVEELEEGDDEEEEESFGRSLEEVFPEDH